MGALLSIFVSGMVGNKCVWATLGGNSPCMPQALGYPRGKSLALLCRPNEHFVSSSDYLTPGQ